MKYLIKESQYVYLLENLEKNKKFLTNHMGIDFTGKLKQITSAYKVPYNFYRNGGITLNHAMSYLNNFGPMYLFELGDYEYLYQDRGNKDWFIDERGVKYIKDEFLERLGLDELGLRFSDIIDLYFNEEETLNESVDKNKRFLTKLLGEDLINSIREITSPNQLPKEFLKSIGTSIIQRYIDVYGPLYYFVLDGEPFLYKERISPKGEKYEMYITDKGKSYLEGEITDRLGLSDMGLNFSDVIDTIFNEGESLNEENDMSGESKEKTKIKNLLKRVLEDQEFEYSFEDNTGYYTFHYHMRVEKNILGTGSDSVAGVGVIIDDILVDGESVYLGWVEIGYNENVWYIEKLHNHLNDEVFEVFPFSIYPTFYGYDEEKTTLS
jgi:hypothetical protein